jgi:2-amino-4-hydroxy-6-hydroxymethyldihydropteridine diphosphokinase
MTQRRFVLVPLAEIAPELRHPAWTGTVEQLLAETPDKSKVQRIEPTEKKENA